MNDFSNADSRHEFDAIMGEVDAMMIKFKLMADWHFNLDPGPSGAHIDRAPAIPSAIIVRDKLRELMGAADPSFKFKPD